MTVGQLLRKLLYMDKNAKVVVSVESNNAWMAGEEISVNEFSRSKILRKPDGSVVITGFANEGEIDGESI